MSSKYSDELLVKLSNSYVKREHSCSKWNGQIVGCVGMNCEGCLLNSSEILRIEGLEMAIYVAAPHRNKSEFLIGLYERYPETKDKSPEELMDMIKARELLE